MNLDEIDSKSGASSDNKVLGSSVDRLNFNIPDDWVEVSLGEVGELDTSGVDKKSNPDETLINLVNYMDVYENYRIDSTLDYMEVTAPDSQLHRSQVEPGDILFTPSSEEPGDIGHSAVVTEQLDNTLHSYHTVRLRPTSDNIQLDTLFSGLMANAPYVMKQFSRRATGSTRYTLTLSDFSNTKVVIPPLNEQRKIASVLFNLDESIQKSNEIIKHIGKLRKAVLNDLFLSGYSSHCEFKSDYIGPRKVEYPAEWELEQLDNLTGKITKGKTPTSYGFEYVESGINFIKVESILENGAFDESKFDYIEEDAHEHLNGSKLQDNDILFSIAGALGKVTLVTERLLPANTNQALALIRVNDSRVKPEYIRYYLETNIIQKYIQSVATVTAQPNLSLKQVSEFDILIPDIDEQEEILHVIRDIESMLENERSKKETMQKIKHGLMQDLLSGEVRTHNKDIEIIDKVLAHG